MNTLSRRSCLALLALPAACSLQPLAPLVRRPLDVHTSLPPLRPAALGQSWTYRVLNAYNGELYDTVTETVSSLTPITLGRQSHQRGELPTEVHSAWGQLRQDPVWDAVQTYDSPLPLWPEPLVPGAALALDTGYRAGTSAFKLWISLRCRVAALERVRLAAGEFDTVRIERFFRLTHSDSSRLNFTRTDTLWLAPALGRWVARETDGEYWMAGHRPTQYREDRLRWEIERWT